MKAVVAGRLVVSAATCGQVRSSQPSHSPAAASTARRTRRLRRGGSYGDSIIGGVRSYYAVPATVSRCILLRMSTSSASSPSGAARLFAAAVLLALLAPAAVRAQTTATAKPLPPREVFGLADDRPTPPAKPAPTAPSQRLGLALRAVPQVALAPVDLEALRAADKVRHDDGKVLRYGVGRAVRAAAQDGSWYRLADGRRLWVLDVASPGALGLRLHLRDLRLPPGAEIAVYAAADEPAAAGAAGRLALYAADQPGLGREVWTPTVLGERARIEYLAPAAGSAGLPFAIDRVQHLYLDPIARLFGKDAGSCNNDVSCYPEWANVAKAVGGLGTVFDDSSLFCTGQLLNDGAGDHTPYFLTANHCLSAPADASTAEG